MMLARDAQRVMMPGQKDSRRTFTLVLLTLAMTVSLMDRYVLAMLIQPIKLELGLSDGAIGVLTGLAFSTFYALFSVVIARLSDRGGRKAVILASLTIWSLLTALSGLVQNFIQLLLARFGVGAGEAGIGPTSHAILAELYPSARRSAVLAVFAAASPAGIMLAFGLSGPLEAAVGWRWTFVLMGLPGLVLALVIFLTSPVLSGPYGGTAVASSSRSDLVGLLRQSSFIHLVLLSGMLGVLSFGMVQWLPAYFERTFLASRSSLGLMLALSQGFGMFAGTLAGGVVTDRLIRRDPQWQLSIVGLAVALALPLILALYLSNSISMAIALVGITGFLLASPNGALLATIQDVCPPSARATGSAVALMSGTFIGVGIGPVVIGVASDVLKAIYPEESLRLAMLFTAVLAGALFFVHFAMLLRARARTVAMASS